VRQFVSMLHLLNFLGFVLGVSVATGTQQYVAFDAASASSTYSMGNLVGSPAFGAQQALSGGSGYWCSSGGHAAGQSVTWTGILHSRRIALGVKVDWAYAPGEVKVLTSGDGANFGEAKCWQSSTRSEAAFTETFMFDAARNVKALTLAMRSPQSWGYFGINSAALIAKPGPLMLVSGITSTAGEQCLVAGTSGITLAPCLEAIAVGDGQEVMQFDKDGRVKSVADGSCLTLVDGDTTGGGVLAMEACSTSATSVDGRAVFAVSPNGQLKLPLMGNYCVTFLGDGASDARLRASALRAVVQDCTEAEQNADARDLFFGVAVPEFDPDTTFAARQSAALLAKSEKRLGNLLAELNKVMPSLAACGFKASLEKRPPVLTKQAVSHVSSDKEDATSIAVAAVPSALGIDMAALQELVTATQEALAKISR